MIAGFEHLQLSLIDYTTPYVMGSVQTSGVMDNDSLKPLVISPNPVNKILTLNWISNDYSWEITNIRGNHEMRGNSHFKKETVDVSLLKPGIYIIEAKNERSSQTTVLKFVKM